VAREVRDYDPRLTADEVLRGVEDVVYNLEKTVDRVGRTTSDIQFKLQDIGSDINQLRGRIAGFDKTRFAQELRAAVRRSITF
jgi:hypothetical protein